MFNFPFFNYPFGYPYYRRYNYQSDYMKRTNNNTINSTSNINNANINNQGNKNSITSSNEISNTIDQAIFQIFGINLYLDDLIILGLLFFLYQQDVKDEMLYIILFLLLFS